MAGLMLTRMGREINPPSRTVIVVRERVERERSIERIEEWPRHSIIVEDEADISPPAARRQDSDYN